MGLHDAAMRENTVPWWSDFVHTQDTQPPTDWCSCSANMPNTQAQAKQASSQQRFACIHVHSYLPVTSHPESREESTTFEQHSHFSYSHRSYPALCSVLQPALSPEQCRLLHRLSIQLPSNRSRRISPYRHVRCPLTSPEVLANTHGGCLLHWPTFGELLTSGLPEAERH